jgi:hypothetical protein
MFTAMFEIRTSSDCCAGPVLRCVLFSFCFVMLFNVPSVADLQEGLINYWPLDGNATDSIGKHDGEVIGGLEQQFC